MDPCESGLLLNEIQTVSSANQRTVKMISERAWA